MRVRKPAILNEPPRVPDSIRYDGWWLVERADRPTAKVIRFPTNPSRTKEGSDEPGV